MSLDTAPDTRTVTAHCTTCRRTETITVHDRDEALNLYDCLGWTGLDDAPLCPDCAP